MNKFCLTLCLLLGVAIAAGPSDSPVSRAAVNDINPLAFRRAPLEPFSTFMIAPETVWTKSFATTYTVGVTAAQDTLMWISAGQTELRIYRFNIKDPTRPLVDSFAQTGGPSGWGIRDMAYKASTDEVFAGFDGQRFHVYDATTLVPNNTYTISGYSGTVRGFAYDPAQDSCWTCNFTNSPMAKFSVTGTNGHQVKAAAEMGSAYGLAWDAVQNCFWVSHAGLAGESPIWKMDPSYSVVDSFNPSGWDLAGGCEMWQDTLLLVIEQATPDKVWCFKFELANHDVGLSAILAPGVAVHPSPLAPRVRIKNLGANPESGIPVTCWIDSGPARVYAGTGTVTGPVAPGATAEFTFTPNWNPGPVGARYIVTMFASLAGDENPANDTARRPTQVTGALFSDTIVVKRLSYYGPTIDGVLSPGEWDASNRYDISDIAGNGGTPQPPGSNYAYYLYEATAEGFLYLGMDFPFYTGQLDYDQFGPHVDEDNSGTWSTDSSEGNYWCEYVGGADDCVYRALLDTQPQVWEMGPTPGAIAMSSLASGHLQYECKIPLGDERFHISVVPGDTVGYFQYSAVAGGSNYVGWWPSTLTGTQWANPSYYGMMVFDPTAVGVETPRPVSRFALHGAFPNVVRDFACIDYYVGRRSVVQLGVYDVSGKLVRTLVDGPVAPGERSATWDRTDVAGRRVSNGTYFYRLTVDGESVSGKAVLLD